MGMYWGGVSDRIGRKPVLLLGCVGTILSLITVGLASNIWIALVGRALGGLLNGNIGVLQTMVAELITKPEHEREYLLAGSMIIILERLTREEFPQRERMQSCPSYGGLSTSLKMLPGAYDLKNSLAHNL
jgi:hypothetical protein